MVCSIAPYFSSVPTTCANRRLLLADGDVDADQVLSLLVDDRVDGESGLAGLTVADDQLALAATDGNQCVDDGDAGLDRRIHAFAQDDAGRDALDRTCRGGLNWTFAVPAAGRRR